MLPRVGGGGECIGHKWLHNTCSLFNVMVALERAEDEEVANKVLQQYGRLLRAFLELGWNDFPKARERGSLLMYLWNVCNRVIPPSQNDILLYLILRSCPETLENLHSAKWQLEPIPCCLFLLPLFCGIFRDTTLKIRPCWGHYFTYCHHHRPFLPQSSQIWSLFSRRSPILLVA